MGLLGRYGDLLSQAQEREDEARAVFSRYDADGSGSIDLEEMRFVLGDLGKLDGIPTSKVGLFLEVEFRKADTDGNGTLSFDEFTSYYNSIERLKEVCNASEGSLESLHEIYLSFCGFGSGSGAGAGGNDRLDGAKWAKLCRDTQLQNKKTFTSVSVDIVFSKVKARGERRIDFEEFKDAISMVAEMKGVTFEVLCTMIKTTGGPQFSGTKAEFNKFADPSTFTGAHAANAGLEAKVRVKADPNWKHTIGDARPTPELERVFAAFCSFGGGRADSMEGKTFNKIMKDCEIFDKKFTTTSADIIFSKAKPKGERKIGILDFCKALQLVAQEKGIGYDDLVGVISTSEGPASSGTRAEANKFHDDKSMYAGSYAANAPGGREVRVRADWRTGREQPGNIQGLITVFNAFCFFGGGSAGAMDNSKFAKCCTDSGLISKKFTSTDADIIFSKAKAKGERKLSYDGFLWCLDLIAESKGMSYDECAGIVVNCGGPACSGTKAQAVRFFDDKSQYTGAAANIQGDGSKIRERKGWKDGRTQPTDDSVPELRSAYSAFCSFGGGDGSSINIKIWGKLVADTGLTDRHFTMTSADIIFSKVASIGAKTLSYGDFLWMVDCVAEEKGSTFAFIAQQIASNGPSSSGTVAEYNKFHDDKSMYTGSYAANAGMDAKVREHKDWKEGRPNPRSVDGMERVFDAFCTFAGGKAGAMGVATWNKMLADTNMFDKRLSHSAADIIFAKVCGSAGSRAVGYVDFKWLLDLAAEEKGMGYDDMCGGMLRYGGPRLPTPAEDVRFYSSGK
mmetsp:Transcript_5622/g.14251  ORF Transcript_5622/g.14251 Transcript_5622/m.14251 type:complete len:792 (+) Transcript_5622:219-2594(+)